MNILTRRTTKDEVLGKDSFSKRHKKLIQKSYPFCKGAELRHVSKKYEELANKSEEMEGRVLSHLHGRAFGFWGAAA